MAEAATSRAEDRKTKKEEGKFTISAKPVGEHFAHCCSLFIGPYPFLLLQGSLHSVEGDHVEDRRDAEAYVELEWTQSAETTFLSSVAANPSFLLESISSDPINPLAPAVERP